MTTLPTCNTGTITPYLPSPQNPWDLQKIKHLYRRLDYGAPISVLRAAQGKSPGQLVDEIMDSALALPQTPPPLWAFKTDPEYGAITEEQLDDLKALDRDEGYEIAANDLLKNGLMGRLAFFWLNHFVTQYGEYRCPAYMYQYYILLQQHALGNFKEFTREIGLTPAMLKFLNNFDNKNDRPNENYARELFELFTLGEDNGYTQEDIEEASRAMTGYNGQTEDCGPISFTPETFDGGTKTIFERTEAFDYDGIIEVLFEERRELIGEFICTKLYTYFVNPEPDAGIIVQMKKTFLDAEFEIAPVLRQLFKSEHFFDTHMHGIVIKSPYDVTIQFLKETGFDPTDEVISNLQWINSTLGQSFFSPVDVAGWQRNRKWLNTNTLPGRWFALENILYLLFNPEDDTGERYQLSLEPLRDFAIAVSENNTDIKQITKAIIDFFMAKELVTIADYDFATEVFMGELPDNYFTNGTWNLNDQYVPEQVALLLRHIVEMPEFQLK